MRKPVCIAPDPQFRLDILLMRVAELATRTVERNLGPGCNLWDAAGGVKAVMERKLKELGVPGEKVTAEMLAEKMGLLKLPKRKARQIRRAG